jgi:hypothetical protein
MDSIRQRDGTRSIDGPPTRLGSTMPARSGNKHPRMADGQGRIGHADRRTSCGCPLARPARRFGGRQHSGITGLERRRKSWSRLRTRCCRVLLALGGINAARAAPLVRGWMAGARERGRVITCTRSQRSVSRSATTIRRVNWPLQAKSDVSRFSDPPAATACQLVNPRATFR